MYGRDLIERIFGKDCIKESYPEKNTWVLKEERCLGSCILDAIKFDWAHWAPNWKWEPGCKVIELVMMDEDPYIIPFEDEWDILMTVDFNDHSVKIKIPE